VYLIFPLQISGYPDTIVIHQYVLARGHYVSSNLPKCTKVESNLANHTAAGDTGRVVTQESAAQCHQVPNPLIADPIEDLLALAPGLDEPAPTQAPQMRRNAALGRVKGRNQLPHTALTALRLHEKV
jgi:hypothetical protein